MRQSVDPLVVPEQKDLHDGWHVLWLGTWCCPPSSLHTGHGSVRTELVMIGMSSHSALCWCCLKIARRKGSTVSGLMSTVNPRVEKCRSRSTEVDGHDNREEWVPYQHKGMRIAPAGRLLRSPTAQNVLQRWYCRARRSSRWRGFGKDEAGMPGYQYYQSRNKDPH